MKHHGLYERDNDQKGARVDVRLLLVGPRD